MPSSRLSVSVSLLSLCLLLNSCQGESTRRTKSTADGAGSLNLNQDADRKAVGPDEVLGYVEDYLIDNTNTFTWRNQVIYAVNTYVVPSDNIFYKVADTYDNALAAIFWTEIGKPENAAKLLNSYLRLMGFEGYNPAGTSLDQRVQSFAGLPVRYDFKKKDHLVPPAEPSDSGVVDTGNNSYMGLAFCKFYNKYRGQLGEHAPLYWQTAFDLWAFLHTNRQCPAVNERGEADPNGAVVGYQGRAAVGGWVSTEHNVDMYALASCLMAAPPPGKEGVVADLEGSKTIAGRFLDKVFVNDMYRTGADHCSAPVDPYARVAVDAQTWRFLAGAHGSNDTNTLAKVADPNLFFTADTDQLPNGCEASADGVFEDVAVCSSLPEEDLHYGVRFSDQGRGLQVENTAAAYMAFTAGGLGSDAYAPAAQKIHKTLMALLMKGKSAGVPASFRTHSLHREGDPQAKLYNTGLDWDYFKYPHTASTVWTGLALAANFTGQATAAYDDGFNPYSSLSSKRAVASTPITSIDPAGVTSYPCNRPYTWANVPAEFNYPLAANHHPACVVGAETLPEYCSTLCGAPATWFDASLDNDPFLKELGVNRGNLCTLCGHTTLNSCSPERLNTLAKAVWKKYNADCRALADKPACVTALRYENYQDTNWNFCLYQQDQPDPRTWTRRIRSLVVPRNTKATLCNNSNECRSFFAPTPKLGRALAAATALRVESFQEHDFSMAIASDPQYDYADTSDEKNRKHADAIAALAKKLGPHQFAGVIMNGDLTNTASHSQLSRYRQDYQRRHGLSIWHGLGNHDYDNYYDTFGHGDGGNLIAKHLDAKMMVDYFVDQVGGLNVDVVESKGNWSPQAISQASLLYSKDLAASTFMGLGTYFAGYQKPEPRMLETTYDGSLAYSWDIGPYHFVELNNYPAYAVNFSVALSSNFGCMDRYFIRKSLDWLEADLKKAGDRKVVLNMHVMGTTRTDRFSMDTDPEGWTRFINILAHYKNIVAVFAGHYHDSWPGSGRTAQLTDPGIPAGGRHVPLVYSGASGYNKFLWARFLPGRIEVKTVDSQFGRADVMGKANSIVINW